MRSLGFGSKVVAVCFFAAAVILTLGLPWYGLAPVEPVSERTIGELHGPLDGLFDAVVRWFGEHDHGVSAWKALGTTDKVIALFAIFAAVSAVLANLANVEHAARAMLRGGGALRRLQTGVVTHYALVMIAGVIAAAAVFVVAWR